MTRAYIAGFGTAGSLLAGAAILFVVATAFVSYHGWPTVAYTVPTPALVLPHKTFYGVAATPARRVITASATQTSASRATPAAASSRAIAAVPHPRQHTATTIASSGGQGATKPVLPGTPVSGSTPPPPPPCCTSPTAGSGLAGATTTLTGAVGSGVGSAGKNLGSTVTAVGGALANTLSGVSPGVSTLVSGTGQALGNAVTQVTQAAGGAVAGTGQLLGGILAGLGQH